MSTSIIPLIEKVERSLYEALRLKLVEHGYLPDITTFADTGPGLAAYNAAISGIVSTKGFAIELFGTGSSDKKYTAKTPRFTILEQDALPGAIGGIPGPTYIPVYSGGPNPVVVSYDPTVLPPQTRDFQYRIGLLYETAEERRVMLQILGLGLPARGYINWYDEPTREDKIFVKQIGHTNQSFTDEGYRQSSYIYQVEDLFETSGEVGTSVAPISEITVEIRTADESPTIQPTPDSIIKVP